MTNATNGPLARGSRRPVGSASPNGSSATAELEYPREELGDLLTHPREDLFALTDGVGNVRQLGRGRVGAECREVGDISGIALGYDSGGFAQREGPVELARSKFQDRVAMRPCHSENKICVRRDLGRELSRGEVGYVATQLLEG